MTNWLEQHLPKMVLAPSFIAVLVFVYGFIAWTAWVSLTRSRLAAALRDRRVHPVRTPVRLAPRGTRRSPISTSSAAVHRDLDGLGLLLAILLDQQIRTEGVIRTIYLYPMALSLIVTGTAWKWILNPGLGIEAVVRQWGFEDFTFDWLVDPDMAIYTVVHCRSLAKLGLRDGAVPRRAAVRRHRDHQGRAGRRHPDGASTPPSSSRRWRPSSCRPSSCWRISRSRASIWSSR
jgi:hypothetical protein